ncbi:FAD-binding oxidoreductase [Leptobacterium sp. I13]|uniref:NAD(P)/FAD-dependent oxidoreductase n=1 Tax=Leptobacterium meishanense TaxID=3128904 RepID=UPI0030EF7C33
MIDYIIVGLGLAGISFCEILEKNNKSYVVFDDDSQQSSRVAGGLYNPVILKRYTKAWKAGEQLEMALPFYRQLEAKFNKQFDHQLPVYRRFASIEEQNRWYEVCDKPEMASFLSTQLIKDYNSCIDAPFGYGEVLGTGRIAIKALQKAYKEYLSDNKKYVSEPFEYERLEIDGNKLSYKDIAPKKIVFCEGFGMIKNPFFNYLPLNGTKGELITIKAPKLILSEVVKSAVFIIPLGDDLYKIGATYKWKDKTNKPTKEARKELLEKLATFLKCDFEVINQEAGIRPTVADRRPLIGQHPKHKNIYLLNGLGTRGVMVAPYVSKQLYNHIEYREEIDKEITIERYESKYVNTTS